MTGQEIIDWIRENHAENDEIYIEKMGGLFADSKEFMVLAGEDCPCMEMVVLR